MPRCAESVQRSDSVSAISDRRALGHDHFRGQGNRRVAIASSRLLRVVGWNVIDQMLSALSNLGLSIAVARTTSAGGFGAFAVSFLLFGISLAVTKSAVGQPLQIRLSGASAADTTS